MAAAAEVTAGGCVNRRPLCLGRDQIRPRTEVSRWAQEATSTEAVLEHHGDGTEQFDSHQRLGKLVPRSPTEHFRSPIILLREWLVGLTTEKGVEHRGLKRFHSTRHRLAHAGVLLRNLEGRAVGVKNVGLSGKAALPVVQAGARLVSQPPDAYGQSLGR